MEVSAGAKPTLGKHDLDVFYSGRSFSIDLRFDCNTYSIYFMTCDICSSEYCSICKIHQLFFQVHVYTVTNILYWLSVAKNLTVNYHKDTHMYVLWPSQRTRWSAWLDDSDARTTKRHKWCGSCWGRLKRRQQLSDTHISQWETYTGSHCFHFSFSLWSQTLYFVWVWRECGRLTHTHGHTMSLEHYIPTGVVK